ncbi:MAG: isoprenyl transferase [Clostridiales bacterium]|jgi:undecaprenyl diphosphate synthase|nr:isoprenyl transferase [Clostridiales bacterium]
MTQTVPAHVAIIMDGNGRWAKKRHLAHTAGHRAGAQALKKLAPAVEKLGVKYLTVYAFSTENWKRPQEEVSALMKLIHEYIQQYIDDTKKNDMRIFIIGDKSRLEPELRRKIAELEATTETKPGLQVNIALNYGGRDEITRAARNLAKKTARGEIVPEDITETFFANQLDTGSMPYPDLLIKTGGEMRLSNFLLWKLAYTEIYVLDKFWPDFTINDMRKAIDWFNGRERRFGGR